MSRETAMSTKSAEYHAAARNGDQENLSAILERVSAMIARLGFSDSNFVHCGILHSVGCLMRPNGSKSSASLRPRAQVMQLLDRCTKRYTPSKCSIMQHATCAMAQCNSGRDKQSVRFGTHGRARAGCIQPQGVTRGRTWLAAARETGGRPNARENGRSLSAAQCAASFDFH